MTSPIPIEMEPWQWLYLAIVAVAGLRCLAPAVSAIQGSAPMWLMAPATLGMLSMHAYGLGFTFLLHVLLLMSAAPLGASALAALFTLGSVVLFVSPAVARCMRHI
jgi:hypothetical protein